MLVMTVRVAREIRSGLTNRAALGKRRVIDGHHVQQPFTRDW
jgi:hypothetical protein